MSILSGLAPRVTARRRRRLPGISGSVRQHLYRLTKKRMLAKVDIRQPPVRKTLEFPVMNLQPCIRLRDPPRRLWDREEFAAFSGP